VDASAFPATAQLWIVEAFQNADLHFRVIDNGPPEGPPVVLLHGFPQGLQCWDSVAPFLHTRGVRTLTFDQRGYAPGARPRGRLAYRLRLLVDDVLALLDAVGLKRSHVVGHDWGGAVAWSLASWRPERVATATVLSTPHPAAFLQAMVSSRQMLRCWHMLVFQPPRLAEHLFGPCRPAGERRLRRLLEAWDAPPAVVERAVALTRDREAFTAMLNWYRAIPLSSPRQAFVRCRVPTLFVWSTGDAELLGRRAAGLTGRYVRAPYDFRVLRGASHWLPEEQAQTVADLIASHVARHG
jgi:pimeloyl-ACP methyl ester carboxylesterase